MRLSTTQVQLVCQKVLHSLKAKQLITIKAGEADVLKKMEEIAIKELKVEDQINLEAERLLAQYTQQAGSNIDKDKMFRMIKQQLIKDKKVIL